MNKILESTKYVVENSDFVKINHNKVDEFAKDYKSSKINHWLKFSPFDFSNFTDGQKLHFLFIFHSICFSFWGNPKWSIEYKNKKYDGSWGMLIALGKTLEKSIPFTNFEYLMHLKKTDLKAILKGNIEMPLFDERYAILKEISKTMVDKFNGKVINLINEANNDALKLLELIVKNFPSFSDISKYKNKEIYFYKRAQLFIRDIYELFNKRKLLNLNNIDQITAFADYKIPQILRKLDILTYTPSLAEKIDNKIELSKNSNEENEIRANAIWAVEFLKNNIKNKIPNIKSYEINDYLWVISQNHSDKILPYHLTRSISY